MLTGRELVQQPQENATYSFGVSALCRVERLQNDPASCDRVFLALLALSRAHDLKLCQFWACHSWIPACAGMTARSDCRLREQSFRRMNPTVGHWSYPAPAEEC